MEKSFYLSSIGLLEISESSGFSFEEIQRTFINRKIELSKKKYGESLEAFDRDDEEINQSAFEFTKNHFLI